jgi:hypothetical protein
MTKAITTPRIPPQERGPHIELVAIPEKDVADVARFIAAQSGRTTEAVKAHLVWFLLENSTRRPHDPLGVGLGSAGELVGCILCGPQAFRFEDPRIVLAGSSSFYVDDRHRGHGGRVFLHSCRLVNHRLFGTATSIPPTCGGAGRLK